MARRREAQAAATRKAILRTARQLFAKHGFRRTSIDQIARRIGAARSALYHHFENKEEVLRAVVAELEAEVGRRASEATESLEGWAAIEAGCEVFLEAHVEPAFRRIVVLDAPAVLNWDRSATPAVVIRLASRLRPLLRGSGIEAEAAAESLYGVLQGLARFVARSPEPRRAHVRARELFSAILGTLRERAKPLDPHA